MRVFLSTILLIIYATANIGAVLQYHYCGGDLVYISTAEASVDCCSPIQDDCSVSSSIDDCCDDKYELVKTDIATKTQLDFDIDHADFIVPSIVDYHSWDAILPATDESVAYLPNGPPLEGITTPLYILYQSQKIDC